jgi:hypothetical protein
MLYTLCKCVGLSAPHSRAIVDKKIWSKAVESSSKPVPAFFIILTKFFQALIKCRHEQHFIMVLYSSLNIYTLSNHFLALLTKRLHDRRMAPMSPWVSTTTPWNKLAPSPPLYSRTPRPFSSFHNCISNIRPGQPRVLFKSFILLLSPERHVFHEPSICLPEILIQILASCDTFAQAVALSSTCKDVYAVWLSNTSPILDRVGRQCIPAFDEAVVAVGARDPSHWALLRSSCWLPC